MDQTKPDRKNIEASCPVKKFLAMGNKPAKSKTTRQDIEKPNTGLQTTPDAIQNTTTSAYNLRTAEDVKVSKWLKSVGNRILIYQDAFAEYGFDSLESISTMRKQDLHDLKVFKTGTDVYFLLLSKS